MKGTKPPLLCLYNVKSIDISEDKKIEIEPGRSSSTGSLRDLVDTPFKRAMFIVQILSYILIVGSPLLGGGIGRFLELNAAKTGGLILGFFIAGEILFYGSLIFLGKEVVRLLRAKMSSWFKRRSSES